jgi:hypothetical protein
MFNQWSAYKVPLLSSLLSHTVPFLSCLLCHFRPADFVTFVLLTEPLLSSLLCHYLSWVLCHFVLLAVTLLSSCLQCHLCPAYCAIFVLVIVQNFVLLNDSTFVILTMPRWSWLLYCSTFVLLTVTFLSCLLCHFCPAYCATFVLLFVPFVSWLLCHFRSSDFAAGPASCLITIISSRGFDCLALCLYYSSVCNNLLFLQETDMRRKNPLWYESRMWWRDK